MRKFSTDTLVIGSSPSNLVRAVKAAQDSQVVVCDNSQFLGGAWQSRPTFGDDLRRYEFATHLLSPMQQGHEIIESSDIPLQHRKIRYLDFQGGTEAEKTWLSETLETQFPKQMEGGGYLFSWSQYRSLVDSRSDFDPVYLDNRIKMHIKQENEFKYFVPGVAVLIDRLAGNAFKAGAEIILGENVRSIDITSGKSALVRTSTCEIETNKVFGGRHMQAEISIDNTVFDLAPRTNHYTSLLIRINSNKPQPYPYVAVTAHSNLTAIQKSYPCRTKEVGGSEVYCLAGNFSVNDTPIETAKEYVDLIIQNRTFNKDSMVLDAKWEETYMPSLATQTCESLFKTSKGVMELFPVTNIMRDICDNADLWRQALSKL